MSVSYRIAEQACYMLNSLPIDGARGMLMGGFKKPKDNVKLPAYVKRSKLIIDGIEFEGFKIHRLRIKSDKKYSSKAVLFLPGGGGMERATILHYDTAMKIAKESGADVYIVHYPLAPKYNVRYALDWLEKLYMVLVKKYSERKITFLGDSAGANLIISLAGRVHIKPGKLIVISPACGLENGKNRNIRLAMEPFDPILNVEMNDIICDNWCKDVPLDSPDISPEYVDYTGFPKMYLYYGEHELFYPHVINYIDILKERGVTFHKTVKPMCHDWAICRFFPEGRKAVKEMCDIIERT